MRDRANAMRARVIARLSREAVDVENLQIVDRSVSAALSLRDGRLADDHHVDMLHPARSALILMDDAAIADPVLVAAAATLESRDLDLTLDLDRIDLRVSAVVRGIPSPVTTPRAELVEMLLSLNRDRMAVALSERLDHARHLHLRSPDLWAAGLELEECAYLPLAARFGGAIGRRYDRWHRAFVRRSRAQQ